MSDVNLTVEVHCLQPRWIEHEKAKYRIYVNDDLIIERTWIWDQDTVIEENITVDVTPEITHTVRVECIKFNRGDLAQFGFRKFYVNSRLKADYDYRDMCSFTISA